MVAFIHGLANDSSAHHLDNFVVILAGLAVFLEVGQRARARFIPFAALFKCRDVVEIKAFGKLHTQPLKSLEARQGFCVFAVLDAGCYFGKGGFKPEVQHLLPSKVRRCHHLVRPRPISNFSPKSASPLPA